MHLSGHPINTDNDGDDGDYSDHRDKDKVTMAPCNLWLTVAIT